MKLAIVGDMHVSIKGASDVMFYHQKRWIDDFLAYLKENDIKTVLQLGDLFDSRKAINLKSLKFVRENLFEPLRDMGVEFYTLIGNHDIFYRESLDVNSSGLLLNEFTNVHVIEEPSTLEFDGLKFDLIPWMAKSNEDACREYIKDSDSEYCLGHFEITGYQVLKGVVYDRGLNGDTFKSYKKVFSGHFHIRQERGNILYVGTPYWLTWNDAGTAKGFYVFDTTGETLTFVENTKPYYFYLTYDDQNNVYSDLEAVDLFNAFVKLKIENKNVAFQYLNFVNRLYAKKPYDVKFVEKTDEILEEAANQNVSAVDTITLIKEYIAQTDYTNKDELTTFLVSLYNEALTLEEGGVE